jgi:hypothetical protein
MSVRGKDFRGELEASLHEKLRIMAEHADKEVGRFGIELLEKAIAGEWHAFSLMLERAERSGMLRKAAEKGGEPRK